MLSEATSELALASSGLALASQGLDDAEWSSAAWARAALALFGRRRTHAVSVSVGANDGENASSLS